MQGPAWLYLVVKLFSPLYEGTGCVLRMAHRGQPHFGRFGKESRLSAPNAMAEGCCAVNGTSEGQRVLLCFGSGAAAPKEMRGPWGFGCWWEGSPL